ncbi:hypothetical protein AQUCO_06800032v1 [Aquilegia coerulea]|uniref:Glutamate receptor n=1 Tax=Aquilegia coerulea TaxID=218851 RepID=A0A2G5CBF9_AQUCA|nr:hypothetical protein AQUCO_06800032v1 [Aquilegia coerulea]
MRKSCFLCLRYLFILSCFLLYCCTWTARSTTQTSYPVGVILDLGTATGKICNRCISIAVSDFYAVHGHYNTRLVLHTRNAENVVSAVFEAVNLLKDVEVHAIVGPQKSAQAEFVVEQGNKSQVPVISFSATSPSLSRSHMPYFIRMIQNDTYQLEAIASIIQAFGWKEVILIYEETDYGNGIIHFLLDAFQSIDVRVSYRSVINPLATGDEVLKELHKLSTMKTRIFVVHMVSPLGPLFFLKVKETGLMTAGNAWIITEELTSLLASMNFSVIDSMRGVLGIRPYIPRTKERDNFRLRLMREIVHESATMDHDLNIFCLKAYDTIWMLAMAAEKLGIYGFRQPARYKNSSTHSAEPGVLLSGPELLKEILRTKFRGLSGDIRLINGQIQPSVFQILNVVGMGEREVGFWIPKVGLSQYPDVMTMKQYKTSQTDLLRPIIWPGESTIVPSIYMNKLKIGFPIKHSFTELVKQDLNQNKTIGYCIDIFSEVMKELPCNVPYELIPYQRANGESAGNYNSLVEQVSLQIYDAVIGDITITSHRSALVDFSLPFTIGGDLPKGSPLVSDVNRAILSVVEGPKMVGIETMWLGSENDCPKPSNPLASGKVHLKNLAWLFFCIYLMHILSVVPFLLAFIYRDSGNGIWKGLINLYEIVPKSSPEAVEATVPIDESGTGPASNQEVTVHVAPEAFQAMMTRKDSGSASDQTGSLSEIDDPAASSSTEEIIPWEK